MPGRGDPAAAKMLADRNQHNSEAYKRLSEDQALCLTSRVFYGLGGYPNYSALSVTKIDPEENAEVIICQHPSLEPSEELRLRPIYNEMFDHVKIEKDKRMSLEYGSVESLDRRALQSFNKHRVQVSLFVIFLPDSLQMCWFLIFLSSSKGTT